MSCVERNRLFSIFVAVVVVVWLLLMMMMLHLHKSFYRVDVGLISKRSEIDKRKTIILFIQQAKNNHHNTFGCTANIEMINDQNQEELFALADLSRIFFCFGSMETLQSK